MYNFWLVGVNYKRTDASVRGLFAINTDQYHFLLKEAPNFGIKELFVVSTCNRTELYAVADSYEPMIQLLCLACAGDEELLKQIAYIKHQQKAALHLFEVAGGLDSQILGDFEILGQIKASVKISKAAGFIGSFMERLINSVYQSSKAIKTHTALSSGTVSVSFAAVQYLKQWSPNIANQKILLIGTGKIGRTTCKNLVDYLQTNNITIVNRTFETAAQIAQELNIAVAPMEDLQQLIQTADIIIVSTNAVEPIIKKEDILAHSNQLFIDLSVPCNIDPQIEEYTHTTLVNVDVLSKIKDATLENRQKEVPKAKKIIGDHYTEFEQWQHMRKHAPVLKAVKTALNDLPIAHFGQAIASYHKHQPQKEKIQLVLNGLANKMRINDARGCLYIQAINEYIAFHES